MNNVYLRDGVIATITNMIVFIISWGCIVPDQMMDQTHLFGLIGNVEIIRGNTSTVFGIASIVSTLVMVVSLVEAIVEDCRRPCFNQSVRVEKPRKPQKFEAARMRIEPTSEKVCEDPKTHDEDPKTPTLD